jgi:hypothetical protein
MEYPSSSYLCLVEEVSERGLRLLPGTAVNMGERMRVDLHISQDARLSCVIEIRQVTRDGLGAEIVDIAQADADVLRGRIEEHYLAVRRAKAASGRLAAGGPSLTTSNKPSVGIYRYLAVVMGKYTAALWAGAMDQERT